MIRLARPALDEQELSAVGEVLASGALVQGARVAAFERGMAEVTGRGHAVAVSSGTAALSLALRAVGVGPGDEVICPDLTWPSPAHAIMTLGAQVVLVDVDPHDWNAAPPAYAAACSPRTRAAIAIDQLGVPSRADAITEALAGAQGTRIPLVVDAACSLGSRYRGRPCGSFGEVACLSFHPRKVLTTGEGGMCLTDDAQLAERLRVLRNHGQRAPGEFAEPSGNFRLTELAAALGLVQLGKLAALVAERRRLASRYREALSDVLQLQAAPEQAEANAQTMGALLPAGTDAAARDRCIRVLGEAGIEVGRLSYALHRLPTLAAAAQQASAAGRDLSTSASLVDRGIALPLYPGMPAADQDRVIDAVRGVLGGER